MTICYGFSLRRSSVIDGDEVEKLNNASYHLIRHCVTPSPRGEGVLKSKNAVPIWYRINYIFPMQKSPSTAVISVFIMP